MKYISKIYNKVFVAALATLLLAGCSAELEIDPIQPGGNNGKAETVNILLSVPDGQTPSTKSMAGEKENKVENIDVLIFDVSGTTEVFSYRKEGTFVTNVAPQAPDNKYKTKFKVTLLIENNQKLVVVANAQDLINKLLDGNGANGEITKGMNKVDVLKQLSIANVSKWKADDGDHKLIPMYGEFASAVNIKAGDNFDMNLVRMLARVDIHNKDNSNFSIKKVYLAKPMTQGYIAPVWDANGKTIQTAATAINVDPTWTRASGFLMYDMSAIATGDTDMKQSYKGEIYTFETKAASGDGENDASRIDATCLVVEGIYNGQTYFYRVDFTNDGAGAVSDKSKYLPLLRNYKYDVIIEKADGIGYSSYNEALSSYTVKSNLKTRIIHYDQSVLTNIVSNGQYMLGVEYKEMTIDWTGMPMTNFIVTDYDYTYSNDTNIDPVQHENGWRIVGYSDTENGSISPTPPAWMYHAPEKETSGATKCKLTISAHINAEIPDVNGDINFSPASIRTTYIHIQAGRLTQKIKVTQNTGTQLINMPRQYPNCYMIQSGGTVLIPALKPWLVWRASQEAGGVGAPLNPRAPVTCEIVWQDTKDLIAELELVGLDQGGARSSLFVRGTPGKSGNAVVAVKVDGEIVWSWHVWVSNYEPGNGTGVKHLMDRNMGALMTTWAAWSEPGAYPGSNNSTVYTNTSNTIIGLHYQFGRKDPYSPKLTKYGQPMTDLTNIADNTLKTSINNPHSFITTWKCPVGVNAWKNSNVASPKTIHDPCPLGWRVPEGSIYGAPAINDLLAGAASSGFSAYSNGYRAFDGSTYGFNGVRDSSTSLTNGGTSDTKGSGYYWMNESSTFLGLSYTTLWINNKYPSPNRLGFSVRCVKDEKTGSTGVTPDPVPENYNFYVGAFWKADQIGERLIKMAAPAGDWTATVTVGDDWVKLDKKASEDPNIYTANPAPMLTATEDHLFQVTGTTATTVTGTVSNSGTTPNTGEISFRIGLKSTLPGGATAAPRYGVVLLSYENNTKFHKIYLRQGEEPDYLMRVSDPVKSGGMNSTTRPAAVKYSPYNLTDPNWGTGDSNITSHNQLVFRGAYFANYPSQAGYFFQWAVNSQPRRALHPVNPTGVITNWDTSLPATYWNTLYSVNSVCPQGYEYPNDGSTTGSISSTSVAGSQLRQSLWLNPQSSFAMPNQDNCVSGYYADGFFDRRVISSALGKDGASNSAVSISNYDVAYKGMLFYNPISNNSLFLPFAGYRSLTSGYLGEAGKLVFHYSASKFGQSVLTLHCGSDEAQVTLTGSYNGFPVRCIKL